MRLNFHSKTANDTKNLTEHIAASSKYAKHTSRNSIGKYFWIILLQCISASYKRCSTNNAKKMQHTIFP